MALATRSNNSRWPAVERLFLELHAAVTTFVDIYPRSPVLIVDVRLVEPVMTATTFLTHDRRPQLHLDADDHVGRLVRQSQFMHVSRS
jgi:hypothetical protein